MTTFDGWDPAQYNRFATEREQPFWDLARLLEHVESPVVVDMGCGDGRLTVALSNAICAATTLGIERSPAMISAAAAQTTDRIRFEIGDIGEWERTESFDIVFANASMQWVPDHPAVLARWTRSLRRGGQLAVQVPANADHIAHLMAAELAHEWLDDPPPDPVALNVLAPERYAELLDELGFGDQQVRLQVYAHHLQPLSSGSRARRSHASRGRSGMQNGRDLWTPTENAFSPSSATGCPTSIRSNEYSCGHEETEAVGRRPTSQPH